MSKDTLYSKQDVEKLDKYTDVLDKLVDKLDVIVTEDLKGKDARKVRILLETIATSTESIHKAAANKAKAEANSNDNDIKKLIAASIQELNASKTRTPELSEEDRLAMFDNVKTAEDIVSGEDGIGNGYLSMSELKGDN